MGSAVHCRWRGRLRQQKLPRHRMLERERYVSGRVCEWDVCGLSVCECECVWCVCLCVGSMRVLMYVCRCGVMLFSYYNPDNCHSSHSSPPIQVSASRGWPATTRTFCPGGWNWTSRGWSCGRCVSRGAPIVSESRTLSLCM